MEGNNVEKVFVLVEEEVKQEVIVLFVIVFLLDVNVVEIVFELQSCESEFFVVGSELLLEIVLEIQVVFD